MSVALPTERMNVDEFLDWCTLNGGIKCELVDGRIEVMSPEKLRHVHVKSHAWLAFKNAITKAGVEATAHADGASVRIDETTVREPDVVVSGAKADFDSIFVADPILVVEVISPSSQEVDTGAKLAEYFSLASVRHYLVIEADRRFVIHYERPAGQQTISTNIVDDGAIHLDPPGVTVALADLFEDLDT